MSAATRRFAALALLLGMSAACRTRLDPEEVGAQPVDLGAAPPGDACLPPPDLAGLGSGVWFGPGTEVTLAGRRFYYEINIFTEGGPAGYTMQVYGDDTVWQVGCRAEQGGYLVANDAFTACGCEFRLQVTPTPNQYILNGMLLTLQPTGPCVYHLGPTGLWGISCG